MTTHRHQTHNRWGQIRRARWGQIKWTFPSGGAHASSPCFPASTVRDPPDLLDIDMDQLSRRVSFVTLRGGLRGTDHVAGERVTLAQIRHLVTAQDPADRPSRHTQLVRKLIGTHPQLAPSPDDLEFDPDRGTGRRPMRP